MPLIVHLTSILLQILLFCPETDTAAVNKFITKPDNRWKVLEGQNITFEWTYSLDGTIGLLKFLNATGSTQKVIAQNLVGTTTVVASFQQRFTADITDTVAKITMLTVQRLDQGKYHLDITTSKSGLLSHEVELIVQSPPKITNKSSDLQRVNESSDLLLFCEAIGEPPPNITWTKDGSDRVLHTGSTWNLMNINGSNAGTYRCTAYNGAGNAVNYTLEVIVDFLSRIGLNGTYYVARGGKAYLHCQVEGHPPPTITWTPCGSQDIKCDKRFLNISEVQEPRAIYTCRASNYLGEASASTTLVIGGKDIYLTLIITDVKCTEQNGQAVYEKSVSDELKVQVDALYQSDNYIGTEQLADSCGSLHVDLVLKFKSLVAEDSVLDILRNATKNGKLGKLKVNASSIVGIPPVIKSTVTPPTTTPTPNGDAVDIVPIVVGVVCGVVVVAIIVAVVLLWRKKKCCNCCAKDSKEVSNDEAAGPQKSGTSSGTGNNGYVDSGSAYAQPNLPPTKTAGKKEKKPAKKGKDPQPAALPLYAQVDKTKKKPREPENTYDDANDQRRRQPGEVTYTTLDHSDQGASLPRGAANQTTRPAPYTETTYAVLV